MIEAILLAWMKLLALDGDLARAEPKTLRPGSCTPPPAWSTPQTPENRRVMGNLREPARAFVPRICQFAPAATGRRRS